MKPKSIKFAAMTIQDAQSRLLFQLYHVYDNQEAANISDLVMEKLTGWRRVDRILHKKVKLSQESTVLLEKYTQQLLQHRPVQYVLNESWFYGSLFYVDENVLIPRPETEELVDLILKSENLQQPKKILDIGTGSGCIAISIKLKSPAVELHACDISAGALSVASKNANTLKAQIFFHERDILHKDQWPALPVFDVIVSNPPYIPLSERDNMRNNVLLFEPESALFVPDDNALVFYEAIALFGISHLNKGGTIYLELHENTAPLVQQLFENSGYREVRILNDMQGKKRMMRAEK